MPARWLCKFPNRRLSRAGRRLTPDTRGPLLRPSTLLLSIQGFLPARDMSSTGADSDYRIWIVQRLLQLFATPPLFVYFVLRATRLRERTPVGACMSSVDPCLDVDGGSGRIAVGRGYSSDGTGVRRGDGYTRRRCRVVTVVKMRS